MNNKEFISELSQRSGYTMEDTQRMVRQVVEAMSASFDESQPLSIPQFGTFEVKKRMERIMVNPSTGQRMLVPPKLVLGFRPNAAIKERLKNWEAENG